MEDNNDSHTSSNIYMDDDTMMESTNDCGKQQCNGELFFYFVSWCLFNLSYS